jgi:hypothetical protein
MAILQNIIKEEDTPAPIIQANPDTLDYNSTREGVKMPEYGRFVQEMVDYCLTITDRKARQRYAYAIANVMAGLNPDMRDVPDYQHKIWDHLAYLSDYKLDIDYPFAINKIEGRNIIPEHLSYPKGHIRFRHYGRLLEKAVNELKEMEEGPQRDELTRLIANRMKRNLADWKGDGVADSKVARDIEYYTEGRVQPNFSKPGEGLMHIGENRFRTRRNKGLF